QIFNKQPGFVTQYGGTLTLAHSFSDNWQGTLTGNYSAIDQGFGTDEAVNLPAYPQYDATYIYSTKTKTNIWGFDGVLNVTLWSLPGADIKAAVPAGYRSEEFHPATVGGVEVYPPTFYTYPKYRRHTESVSGEVHIPIVGEGNESPFFHRLEFSASLR